jgi:hypothetical protein
VALAIEAAAVFVVAFGAIQAVSGVIGLILKRAANQMQGREIWLKFATWILLALEFALKRRKSGLRLSRASRTFPLPAAYSVGPSAGNMFEWLKVSRGGSRKGLPCHPAVLLGVEDAKAGKRPVGSGRLAGAIRASLCLTSSSWD